MLKTPQKIADMPQIKQLIAPIQPQLARSEYGNFLNPAAIALSGITYWNDNDSENALVEFTKLYNAFPNSQLVCKLYVAALKQANRDIPEKLKDVLERKIAEEGLEDECSRQMKAAMVMKPPVPGWKKLPGWKRFSRKEKAYAKWIFIARDKVAERFNVPPAHVMDKHLIASLAANPPDAGQLPSAIRPVPPRFYSFMLDSMKVALERAAEESGKGA